MNLLQFVIFQFSIFFTTVTNAFTVCLRNLLKWQFFSGGILGRFGRQYTKAMKKKYIFELTCHLFFLESIKIFLFCITKNEIKITIELKLTCSGNLKLENVQKALAPKHPVP